jgi:hypothetical protein
MKRLYPFAAYGILLCMAAYFYRYLILTPLSILPLILTVLMYVQSALIQKSHADLSSRTAYGGTLNQEEEGELFRLQAIGFRIFAPWTGPFMLFFSSGIKVCAIIVYLIGLLFGPVIYRIRYGGRIKERMRNEQDELRLQNQKEEQGKWK